VLLLYRIGSLVASPARGGLVLDVFRLKIERLGLFATLALVDPKERVERFAGRHARDVDTCVSEVRHTAIYECLFTCIGSDMLLKRQSVNDS